MYHASNDSFFTEIDRATGDSVGGGIRFRTNDPYNDPRGIAVLGMNQFLVMDQDVDNWVEYDAAGNIPGGLYDSVTNPGGYVPWGNETNDGEGGGLGPNGHFWVADDADGGLHEWDAAHNYLGFIDLNSGFGLSDVDPEGIASDPATGRLFVSMDASNTAARLLVFTIPPPAAAAATAVPEPSSIVSLALGLLGLVGWRCRRAYKTIRKLLPVVAIVAVFCFASATAYSYEYVVVAGQGMGSGGIYTLNRAGTRLDLVAELPAILNSTGNPADPPQLDAGARNATYYAANDTLYFVERNDRGWYVKLKDLFDVPLEVPVNVPGDIGAPDVAGKRMTVTNLDPFFVGPVDGELYTRRDNLIHRYDPVTNTTASVGNHTYHINTNMPMQVYGNAAYKWIKDLNANEEGGGSVNGFMQWRQAANGDWTAVRDTGIRDVDLGGSAAVRTSDGMYFSGRSGSVQYGDFDDAPGIKMGTLPKLDDAGQTPPLRLTGMTNMAVSVDGNKLWVAGHKTLDVGAPGDRAGWLGFFDISGDPATWGSAAWTTVFSAQLPGGLPPELYGHKNFGPVEDQVWPSANSDWRVSVIDTGPGVTWDSVLANADWNDDARWTTTGTEPGAATDATVDAVSGSPGVNAVQVTDAGRVAANLTVVEGTVDVQSSGDLTLTYSVTVGAAGSLIVDGTVNARVITVEGSLSGGGTIVADDVTVTGSGASLAPGASIDTLNIDGTASLADDATYEVELRGNDIDANSANWTIENDAVDITGQLAIEAGTTLSLDWLPTDETSKFGGTYRLATYSGSAVTRDVGQLNLDGGIGEAYLGDVDFETDLGGSDYAVDLLLYDLLAADANLDGGGRRSGLLRLGGQLAHDQRHDVGGSRLQL